MEASHFNLISEALCLNFVNSKNWSENEAPYNFFGEYQHLLPWSLQLGLMTLPQAQQKLALAAQQPQQAHETLERAQSLRETLYRIFFALANAQEISAADLTHFNQAWGAALTHLQVIPTGQVFRWQWADADAALDSMLWPVLHSAAELLISEKLERVKSCQGCNWLFLDTTKAGRRRWCDMRLCGNRAKSRRHYARGKAGA